MSDRLITLLDTSVASPNLGDEIIVDAVRRELQDMFPGHRIVSVPTHERVGARTYKLMGRSEHVFLAGTNVLKSNMLLDLQWRVRPWDLPFMRGIVGMGIGWRGHAPANWYTRRHLGRLLHPGYLHSVRDERAVRTCQASGLENVLNTGCPTLWGIDEQCVERIPTVKGRSCVVTLNSGRPSRRDVELAVMLDAAYDKLYYWPQGIGDHAYGQRIFGDRATFLTPSLAAFDQLLESEEGLDYVGLRLHGGIRALQNARRTIIVAVDHRANDMSHGTGLPVLSRDDTNRLRAAIEEDRVPTINLPRDSIVRWKRQFTMVGTTSAI